MKRREKELEREKGKKPRERKRHRETRVLRERRGGADEGVASRE